MPLKIEGPCCQNTDLSEKWVYICNAIGCFLNLNITIKILKYKRLIQTPSIAPSVLANR